MSVDDNTGRDAKSISQYNIRGLSSHAAQTQQVIHFLGNLTAININDPLAGSLNVLRLVSKESGRVNIPFQFDLGNTDVILGTSVLSEEVCRNDIDPDIRALCREDRSYQEFERR